MKSPIVVQLLSCLTLCDPLECSTTPNVLHHLPESAQTHVHWASDAIQLFHPLSSLSSPAFSLSQHQGLFQWVSFSFFFFSQFFPSGGQTIGASASVSVLPRNIQGWFSLGLTGLISLQSKGLSRVFSSTTVLWHQLLGTQPFRLSSFHILDFSLYFFTLSFNL